jgi:hypothetical protein
VLTFFTTGKPFGGHSGVIQRNALESWKRLDPAVEVILFGDDEGASEVCAELGLRHQPHVERHESGMKYLNYMFARAQEIAKHDYLCYSNCDILLCDDFWRSFERAVRWRKGFLMAGRRWDTDVSEPVHFERPNWATEMQELALKKGFHQTPVFVDFFVFQKGMYKEVPPLVVGRSYWDHWLVWKAISSGIPVVDCSSSVVAVHQNHDYGYHPQGKQGTNVDPVAMRNWELSGGADHMRTLFDATHRVTRFGHVRRIRLRRALTKLAQQKLWSRLMNLTFPLRTRLGLRKQTFYRIMRHIGRTAD